MYAIMLTMAIKFCCSIAFFAVNLQAMETHPTCLRQTGISMGFVVANAVGMLGPYIAYMVCSMLWPRTNEHPHEMHNSDELPPSGCNV